MFSECFDFAPAPTGRGRRKQPIIPAVTQAPVQPQLTPKEQANRLAAQVGVDPVLLDGISTELLQGLNAGDLRLALHSAVTALQQGKAAGESIGSPLADFLMGKIAMLPLATRFPLMAEWEKPGAVLASKTPLALTPVVQPGAQRKVKAAPLDVNFIAFDSLPGADGEHTSGGRPDGIFSAHADADGDGRLRKPKDKAVDKKMRKADPGESHVEALADAAWQNAVELGPQQVRQARVARAFLEDISVNREAIEKDAAARREQEAKKAASRVVVSFEQTKAAVEAGLMAAKKSAQLLAGIGTSGSSTIQEPPPDKQVLAGDVGASPAGGSAGEDPVGKETSGGTSKDADRDASANDRSHTANEGGEGAGHRSERGRGRHRRRRRDDVDRYGDDFDNYGNERRRRDTGGNDDYATYSNYNYDQSDHRRGRRRRSESRNYRYNDDQDYQHSRERGRYAHLGDDRDYDYGRGSERQRAYGHDHTYSDEYDRHYESRRGGYRGHADSRSRSDSRGHHAKADPYWRDEDAGSGSARRESRQHQRHTDRNHPRTPEERPQSPQRSRSRSCLREKKPASSEQPETKETRADRLGKLFSLDGNVGSQAAAKATSSVTAVASTIASSIGAPKIATPGVGAISATTNKSAPKLRQLACRNGWAEYVDQDTGEHVYKNVLSGEMTKKKPVEYGALISDAMNQRRLAWLANQRSMAQMGDVHQPMPGQVPGQMPGHMLGHMAGQMPGQMLGQMPGQMSNQMAGFR